MIERLVMLHFHKGIVCGDVKVWVDDRRFAAVKDKWCAWMINIRNFVVGG